MMYVKTDVGYLTYEGMKGRGWDQLELIVISFFDVVGKSHCLRTIMQVWLVYCMQVNTPDKGMCFMMRCCQQ
jgi:hypothetical protein